MAATLFAASAAAGQAMPGMKMPAKDSMAKRASPARIAPMPGMMTGALGIPMTRMGSGTTWIPDAVMLPSRDVIWRGWDLMGHGFVFGQYDRQSGPRGDTQWGSSNWGMLMATRPLGAGRLQFRTMLSLDPLTITTRGYPLLLQTGENLVDRQHPHDFWMELGALFERPVTKDFAFSVYAAPAGEPALGPVAFMHRPSAMDAPAAPIGHHWQDATHIAFGVLTAGIFTRTWKLEASRFNGREPDSARWDFDPIRLDSWSGRLTVNPGPEWSMTAGYGWLKSPEAALPNESVHRLTASVLHGIRVGSDGQWSSAVVYGVNYQARYHAATGILAETELIAGDNTIFGSAERVEKNQEELGLALPVAYFVRGPTYPVGQLSLGFIREIIPLRGATVGLGARGTVNFVGDFLSSRYGSHHPTGLFVFLRIRPALRRNPASMTM